MTNFLLEPETSAETISYILRHQIKESRRYKPTVPFHSIKKCEDRTRCAFHRRRT
jgi:hypothetical protein